MSSLSKLIITRALLVSLSETECNQLLINFVQQNGLNALMTPFFNQFMKIQEANAIQATQHIDSLNNIISTIIVSRQGSHSTVSIKPTIDTLPKVLVGEIASYLPQKDYV